MSTNVMDIDESGAPNGMEIEEDRIDGSRTKGNQEGTNGSGNPAYDVEKSTTNEWNVDGTAGNPESYDDMYADEYGYDDQFGNLDDDEGAAGGADFTQEDSWIVIDSFFEEKGLVQQQLASFNQFVQKGMQEVVDSTPEIKLYPNRSYVPGAYDGDEEDSYYYKISFGEIYLSSPVYHNADGRPEKIWPSKARLRDLTYSSQIFLDFKSEKYRVNTDEALANQREDEGLDRDFPVEGATFEAPKEFIGMLPIMLQSEFCVLNETTDMEKTEMGECVYDQGGYFIINGGEKVIVAQERLNNNSISCFRKFDSSNYDWIAELRSTQPNSRLASQTHVVIYKSTPNKRGFAGGEIRVRIDKDILKDIPLIVVFRALGLKSDRNIIEHICYDTSDREMMDMLKPSLREAEPLTDTIEALDFIAKRGLIEPGSQKSKRIEYAKDVLTKKLFPHVSMRPGDDSKKALFLGYMVNKLLQAALNRTPQTDRDHYANKRLDMAGPLLKELFRMNFRSMIDKAKKSLQKTLLRGKDFNLSRAIEARTITKGMEYAIATGNWALPRTGPANTSGVSQVLSRLTYAATLSHLRRVNTPLPREGKQPKPRQLHNTHWGVVCPAETPEGQACGLVKNLSLMCHVSVGSSEEVVLDILTELATETLESVMLDEIPSLTKVFLNGNWIGVHNDPEFLTNSLRHMRREADINFEVSIVRDITHREIRIFCDEGRCMRPLYIVIDEIQRLKIRRKHRDLLIKGLQARTKVGEHLTEEEERDAAYSWQSLIEEGVIEFIDVAEEETLMIAMEPSETQIGKEYLEVKKGIMGKVEENGGTAEEAEDAFAEWLMANPDKKPYSTTYTHCEIHPSMILGICASIIPFPDHNQSPRNTYQSAMGKQAMGIYTSNFLARLDTQAYVLYYAQKPMVTTRAMKHMNFRELPAGVNAIVAIMTYTGYNQEDSVIMNQFAIDRGFFRSVFYRTYKDVEKTQNNSLSTEKFGRPLDHENIEGLKHVSNEKLDVDGFAIPGVPVTGGDILIGKISETKRPYAAEGQIGSLFGGNSGDLGINSNILRDVSTCLRNSENGIVDTVMISERDHERFVKVRIRKVRIPQVGDKFASRHGQKGTIGMTYRQEDMPFTKDGISPDIIVNPHAIPSRMTIGHLVECLLSKVGTLSGDEGDATAFSEVTVEDVSRTLHNMGYQRRGNEVMYNGHTGKKLHARIFLGPTYYQRLKHMVDDKIHGRARGPVQNLTRQPTEGRGRDGGLRFGEMERDCLISHGAANFLRDRLFINSDAYRLHICDHCGMVATANLKRRSYICNACGNNTNISQIYIPYACKLLFQELMAMAIVPRLYTKRSERLGFMPSMES